MKLFDAKKQKEWDNYTMIHEPVSSKDLMWRAAKNIFLQMSKIIDPQHTVVVLCGSGNNGGDGLCLAKMFRDAFYSVDVWYFPVSSPTPENIFYLNMIKAIEEIQIYYLSPEKELPSLAKNAFLVDAIMGNGFNPPWKNGWDNIIHQLNTLPHKKIAVDVPSGLHENFEISDEVALRADFTFAIQLPKKSFFYPKGREIAGNWEVVNIGLSESFYESQKSGIRSIDIGEAKALIRKKGLFSSKWDHGHAALICGQKNMPGAALLSAESCLRSGVGLVTAYIPESIFNPFPVRIPEVMLQFTGKEEWSEETGLKPEISAVGIGPGIGRKESTLQNFIRFLQSHIKYPKIIDADAINLLSSYTGDWQQLVKHSVLTPHVKEFDRLFGEHTSISSREKTAIAAATRLDIVIVLKGAYTRVISPDGTLYYNTTGNSGMAKGGFGDTLTGIITGLLAQGYSLTHAAVLGVFIHGLSGDLAVDSLSEFSMLPTDLINAIPSAWQKLLSD